MPHKGLEKCEKGKGTELKMKNPSTQENTGRCIAGVCLKNVMDETRASPAIMTVLSNNSGVAFQRACEKLFAIKEKHGFFFWRLCLPRFLGGYKAQREWCICQCSDGMVGGGGGTSQQQIGSDTHVCRRACTNKHPFAQTLRNSSLRHIDSHRNIQSLSKSSCGVCQRWRGGGA